MYRYDRKTAALLPGERTQRQRYYRAVAQAAEANQLFLDFVKDGLTAAELAKLIERRPTLWGRYANWLDRLPATSEGV